MKFLLMFGLVIALSLNMALAANQSGGFQGMEARDQTGAVNTSDGSIEAAVHQEFTLILESNRTTGYEWQLAKPLDEAIVVLRGTQYEGSDRNLLGAGGTEVWSFRAVGRGKTDIALIYVRPWEKGEQPTKSRTFSISVR